MSDTATIVGIIQLVAFALLAICAWKVAQGSRDAADEWRDIGREWKAIADAYDELQRADERIPDEP